ncbi:MAG: hypothetical protein LBM73_02690 [Candidatus Nomurabacteria bacterium]|nr:hypothetical protein [Candidatus Nomurabacteria bacterium]
MKKKFSLPAEPRRCGGKICYASKSDAESAARAQELLHWQSDLKLSVYFCASCGHWHLTSRNRRELD